MFTGIIEDVGCVKDAQSAEEGLRLNLVTTIADSLTPGQSIAVSGVCLTVTKVLSGSFAVTAVPETLRKTTLSTIRPGAFVNLERAMLAAGRVEGHFVQGHVDAVCRILAVASEGADHRYSVALPANLRPWLVPRGSIAVDGISLTVARLHADAFEVAIIPHTRMHTIAQDWKVGTQVNVECDILGKHVARLLSTAAAPGRPAGVTTAAPSDRSHAR